MGSATRLAVLVLCTFLAACQERPPLEIDPADLQPDNPSGAPGPGGVAGTAGPAAPSAPMTAAPGTPAPSGGSPSAPGAGPTAPGPSPTVPVPGSTPVPTPTPMPPAPPPDAGVAVMARDAGGPAAPVCPSLPKCLAELFAACTPAGACTRQQLPAGASNTCWANGVRMLSAEVAGTTLSRVLRADRSVCYIVEQAGGGRNMPTTVTWRSAAGAPIATSTYTDMGRQLPVTCTGAMPQQVDQSCLNLPQQGGRGGGAGGCAQGACM